MARVKGMGDPIPVSETHTGREFATTHWSVILAAGENENPQSSQALEALCRVYWFPLYAYVRRRGHSEHDAQDLTQAFFTRFLAKGSVRLADREHGRFRSFILTSLKHFLVNEWEKGRTAKRGGGQPSLSLDADNAEALYLAETTDQMSPDRIFEKRWAVALVENVLDQLRAEYSAAGKLGLFDALKGHVWGDDGDAYGEVAARLNTTEGALRIGAHRLRERFRELLRKEVAHTVVSATEIDGELRHLISVLRD